jgi:putative flippase GtrA
VVVAFRSGNYGSQVRIVRYLFVGGTGTIIDISLFALFAKVLGYPYLVVSACTFIISTTIHYFLSVRYVFQSGARFSRNRELLLVFIVSIMGLGVNQVVLYVSVQYLGIDLIAAKIIATGAVFFWNYWSRAYFVFKAPS